LLFPLAVPVEEKAKDCGTGRRIQPQQVTQSKMDLKMIEKSN
jgi:hypothetical protein